MFDTLERLDKDITLSINHLSFEMGDHFWMLLSNTKLWFPLYLLIAVLLFKNLGWKKALVALSSIILTVVCCDQLANIFKNGFERLRPCYDCYMMSGGLHILEARSGFFGFFSAHSANAFGLAICSCLALREAVSHRQLNLYRWLIFSWAALVALSRVFVGKHFLGDILVGCLAGMLIGRAFGSLAAVVTRKL